MTKTTIKTAEEFLSRVDLYGIAGDNQLQEELRETIRGFAAQGIAALTLLREIRYHPKRHDLERDWLTKADNVLGTWGEVDTDCVLAPPVEVLGGYSSGFTNEKNEAVSIAATAHGNHTVEILVHREDELSSKQRITAREALELAKALNSVIRRSTKL